jgi:hypothetical protein
MAQCPSSPFTLERMLDHRAGSGSGCAAGEGPGPARDGTPGSGQEQDCGNLPLQEIGPNNMSDLKDVKAARLWMLPPAAMEVAIKLLWEDKLAHPQWPHVFCVYCFMMHMWRRDLGKNANILFTVHAGILFWGAAQFELPIIAIIFPLSHVSNYTGPWAIRGMDLGVHYKHAFEMVSSDPQRVAQGQEDPMSNAKLSDFYAKLNVSNLHVMNLY